ncbi:ABC transporter ATP-binding protein [Leptothrix ochracea]|uniref:ABC transporter ATP-binding protein n=1 Tax=Leptothrix ochracea TaxID=735331 RepID=UPI0034E263DB
MAFLDIQDVVKDFDGSRAVNHVTLEVPRGAIFALLGPSGCGKTTLLRMLAGFETPTSGRIVLDGQDLSGMAPYQRPINMMFQSYALFPHLTVWDNIAFGLQREKLARAEIQQRVESLLALVQLEKLARRKPHQLSGGQQQRVALARSLAKQPQLLLLDEPLGALDKKLREETQIELVNILGKVGVTCVMVTHDQEEAMTMASQIAVMHEGRLMQVGAPSEIYETPCSRFVADFIGNVNLIEGLVVEIAPDHTLIDTADGPQLVGHGISGTPGMSVTVALRPEKVHLSPQDQEGMPENPVNRVAGVIEGKSYFGSHTHYQIRLPSGQKMVVHVGHVGHPAAQRQHEGLFERGQNVWAHWSPLAHVVLTS